MKPAPRVCARIHQHRAQQRLVGKSLSDGHVKSAAARKVFCAYMCVSARGTRQVARRVRIDSRVLEVNGNRRGDRIFNMLSSHALSTCQRSLPSLNPPPLPLLFAERSANVFAHPRNYSYRLIIASPVHSRPRYPP